PGYIVKVSAKIKSYNSSDVLNVNGAISIDDSPGFNLVFIMNDNGEFPDIIPKDNTYSANLSNSLLSGNSGIARLNIFADYQNDTPDGQPDAVLERVFYVINDLRNMSPELIKVTLPDSIKYDLGDATPIFAAVSDTNGLDDIDFVKGFLYTPYSAIPNISIDLLDNGIEYDLSAGDGIYSGRIKHSDLKVFGGGKYDFLLYAVDKAGNRSSEFIYSIFMDSEILDMPPQITRLIVPDSIKADNSITLLQAEVSDPNGLTDISSVYFHSKKPDGTYANNGDPFYMYDDGGSISGDIVKGDGIYSLTIQIPSATVKGNYVFIFRASDKSGLESNIIEHQIVVY
ncbi:hypothetical protein ACFL5P_04520, partial [candidate division KSB1 bacterium]